jgi:plasmid stability protein
MTYEINIPDDIDRALRARAAAEHKSPEQAILDELEKGLGLDASQQKRRDLSGIAGMRTIDDEARAAFEEQRQIDPELWK